MTSVDELYTCLINWSNSYYNSGIALVSDDEFDRVQRLYETKSGKKFEYLGKSNNNRVRLPCWMGSLAKCKDNHALGLFVKRTSAKDFIITEKIDGVSLLVEVKNKKIRLYTRGDGEVGSDVTHIKDYINLPKITDNIIVRGELVLKRKYYDEILESTENPRNIVSGLVNAKSIDEKRLRYLEFIAYAMPGAELSPKAALTTLFVKYGFSTPVQFELNVKDITVEKLSKILADHNPEYEIDGLVVAENAVRIEQSGEDPKYTIAFKKNKDPVKTRVIRVEWQTSRYGVLCPKVIIEPVTIDDVKISQATAFNAKFIVDNKIGAGTEILIVRSGDVIPHIVEVVKSTQAQLPDCEYEWKDEYQIKAVEASEEQLSTQLVYFMKILDAKGIAEGVIRKMLDIGLNSVDKILFVNEKTLLKCDGIQERSAEKILQSLQVAQSNIDVVKFLLGTSLFQSLGEKKMTTIYRQLKDNIIDCLQGKSEVDEKQWANDLESVGIKLGSSVFIEGIKKVLELKGVKRAMELAIKNSIAKVESVESKVASSGKSFVFSGYRNKELKDKLEGMGHKVVESVSKTTTAVVVQDVDSTSSKVEKARELGVKVITEKDILKYL